MGIGSVFQIKSKTSIVFFWVLLFAVGLQGSSKDKSMNVANHHPLKKVSGLHTIFEDYDAFIIDLWGVVHDGFNPYPGAVECLNHIIESGKPVIFMSNTPRPWTVVFEKLRGFDINLKPPMILTSGDLVRDYLLEKEKTDANHSETYYHLGAQGNTDILSGINIDLVDDIEKATKILLTLYVDEEEALSHYDLILKKGVDRKLEAICANPDKIVVNGDKNRYCAGVFAQRYEAMGGKVSYYGKPHAAIYQVALGRLESQGVYNRQRILMIGDTPDTDILGAIQAGISSALVLSGNTAIALNNDRSPKAIEALLEKQACEPSVILERLQW